MSKEMAVEEAESACVLPKMTRVKKVPEKKSVRGLAYQRMMKAAVEKIARNERDQIQIIDFAK